MSFKAVILLDLLVAMTVVILRVDILVLLKIRRDNGDEFRMQRWRTKVKDFMVFYYDL